MGMIRLYCVGIHFNKCINFAPDLDAKGNDGSDSFKPAGPLVFMSGKKVLKTFAEKFNLR